MTAREVLRVGKTSLYEGPAAGSIGYVAGMAVGADGAPRAYHPAGLGLDHLGNAGKPGSWWGLVTDTGGPDGAPIVQGAGDPAPGFYVSSTSLCDRARRRGDPRRYVDSATIPYIALPPEVTRGLGVRLGDYAAVLNRESGALAFAVFADGGPRGRIGEGSIALAEALGLPSSPRNGGTSRRRIAYVLYPGSRDGWPKSAAEIAARGAALLGGCGGQEGLRRYFEGLPAERDLEEEPWPRGLPRPSIAELFQEHPSELIP